MLVRRSVITADQLTAATTRQKGGERLGQSLVKLGYVTEEAILAHLNREFSFPIVDLRSLEPCPEALQLLPVDFARKHLVLPVGLDESTLTIATADPSDFVVQNAVKFMTGRTVRVVLAPSQAIQRAIESHYDAGGRAFAELLSKLTDRQVELVRDEQQVDLEALQRATEEAPIVKLVNVLLAKALETRASDVHIEPYEKTMRIRYRIDGVLHDFMQPPVQVRAALVSRIKIMAALDISERRLPQDGAMKLRLDHNGEKSIRVSVMPTVHGEKVVLRILDDSRLETDTARLGLDEEGLRLFKAGIKRPFGMVLVTGPTGSGKSTTLYSAISELNDASRNISTAEDPVEMKIDGVSQLHVNEEIGLTFARALRTFLRQDPDVIMVGEIRDTETAQIAIKAALTGHLVLSTLHTNDAPSAISRYLDMGVEPFLVASSVHLIVAQRLARRICPHCKARADYPEPALASIGIPRENLA
ncbi:MAG: GspE/PulE family protein, partial [Candidatus Binatia bacterium]